MIDKYLLQSYYRQPLMRVEDFFKQIYQAEYGVEHILDSSAETRIKEECASFGVAKKTATTLYDAISSQLVRVNLRPYLERGYSFSTLTEMMKKVDVVGTQQGLEARLDVFRNMVESGRIDLPLQSATTAIEQYRANGYGAVRHSAAYRLNYHPHYRVISKKHAILLPLIARIDGLLTSQLNIIVALDGMSGSGKSFYAKVLSEYYNCCNVIACDDFFLPKELATKERLAIAGNNIHHERLRVVLENIALDKPFVYQKFNCKTQQYTDCKVEPKRLTIVEGSYSLCGQLADYMDIGAIFTVDANTQCNRLIRRDRASYPIFQQHWIPLENMHLATLEMNKYIQIDTSDTHYCDDFQ